MFSKLIKKIEEEKHVDIGSELAVSTKLHASTSSLTGSDCSPAKTANESITSQDTKKVKSKDIKSPKSPEVTELENKIKELINQLSDEHRQSEGYKKDLQSANNETRNKQEAFILERNRLQERIKELSSALDKMVATNEFNEEIDGFQNQEMAKIKHLLLRNQKDLFEKEDENRSLTEDLNTARMKIKEMENEMTKFEESSSTSKTLQNDKQLLEAEVDRLKQEALKVSSRSSHLENTLGDLTDENDALKHAYEIYKTKNNSLMEEKEEEIRNLCDRIRILEKRVEDAESGDNDQKSQALMEERKKLENKLEEVQQHLSQVKSSWSEKIHNLETQIYNLNKKMAEDREESERNEKTVEKLMEEAKSFQEIRWTLEESLQHKEKEIKRLQSERDVLEAEGTRLIKEKEEEYNSKMGQLKQQLEETQREFSKEKQELQLKLSKLVLSQTENVEKEIEMETRITSFEDEIRLLKLELAKEEKECSKLKTELELSIQRIAELEKKSNDLELESSRLASELQDSLKLLKTEQKLHGEVTIERDHLMMRNAELSQLLELSKREMEEEMANRQKERTEWEEEIELLNLKLKNQDEKVHELEKGANDYSIKFDHTEQQTATIAKLEEKLLDRNKTIKLQQKRLTDMKKTLQRELKINESDNAQATNGTNPETTGTLMYDANQDGGVYDEVNFRYLRHVIFKFMTSPEYEAQHLIRAVSVLLQFNLEEERFIRDTLDWKMSWFGTKPQPSREAKRPKAPVLSSLPHR